MLFPYQIEGADWLANKTHALLADDMGLGKTAQAILAADKIGAKRILVICPAVARFNWQNEFKKWSSIPRNFKILLTKKDNPDADKSAICSFEYASANKSKLQSEWDLLILDESHFLKSLEASRTVAVFNKRDGIVKRAKRCWAISGTPAPNHIGEMWPLLVTFGITKLSYDQFVVRYCDSYPYNGERVVKGTNRFMIPEIKKMLEKVMLRRKKEDVLKDLPQILMQDLFIEPGYVDLVNEPAFRKYSMPVDRRDELEDILKNQAEKVEQALTDEISIGALMALSDSVSTLRKYTGLQKIEPVAKMVSDELDAGAYTKIVIFAVHRDVVEGLRQRLEKYNPVTIYGGTPPDKRQKNIDTFQNKSQCRVFIGNIQSAGTNITLTAAHQMIMCEQSWVPGENMQAIKRCNRIGSTLPLTVRVISLYDSIDQKISETLRRKMSELKEVFDEKGLRDLWTDDSHTDLKF